MKLKDFTVITKLLIDPFITEAMKVPQLKIKDEEIKQEILQEGLYHFTSSENVDKIIESGHIRPTKGIVNNHTIGKRVFMFSSVPDFKLYIKNMDLKDNPIQNGNFELSAVNMKIQEEDLKNYKTRPQDGAITYKGKCDLEDKDVSKESFVIDLDENKEFTIRKKTDEEIEKGYIPSEELLQKQKAYKTNVVKQTIDTTLIESDYTNRNLNNIFKNIISRVKGAFQKTKQIEGEVLKDNENINKEEINSTINSTVKNDLDENLKEGVVDLEENNSYSKYVDDIINETKEPEVLIPNYMEQNELE